MPIPPAPWSPSPRDPLVVGDDEQPDVTRRAAPEDLVHPVVSRDGSVAIAEDLVLLVSKMIGSEARDLPVDVELRRAYAETV
jgi:hypothetical protein